MSIFKNTIFDTLASIRLFNQHCKMINAISYRFIAFNYNNILLIFHCNIWHCSYLINLIKISYWPIKNIYIYIIYIINQYRYNRVIKNAYYSFRDINIPIEVKYAAIMSVLSRNYSTCFLNKFHALRASIYLFPLLLL